MCRVRRVSLCRVKRVNDLQRIRQVSDLQQVSRVWLGNDKVRVRIVR